METLELGRLLMGRRARLQGLAAWLISDQEEADVVVRRTLRRIWRRREKIQSEMELDPSLYVHLRESMADHPPAKVGGA